jgi:hypothetical protein
MVPLLIIAHQPLCPGLFDRLIKKESAHLTGHQPFPVRGKHRWIKRISSIGISKSGPGGSMAAPYGNTSD